MRQQGGWSFLELVLVMAIMGVVVGLSAHWLGGVSGVSASVARDELVVRLRQQQLQQMDRLTPSVYVWLEDRIETKHGETLFSLDRPMRFQGVDSETRWHWDPLGRFRSSSQSLMCQIGCTIFIASPSEQAALCIDGEGGVWPQACASS